MISLRTKTIFLLSSAYLVGCTNMDFEVVQGSEALRVKGGVKIQSPAPMSVNKVGVFVEGSCTKGFAVILKGGGSGKVINDNLECKDGLFSANVEFSNGDGVKNIIAYQDISVGGNGAWTQDDRDFLKDTLPPVVAITSPVNQAEVGANVTISGNCENGLTVNLSQTGKGALGQAGCGGGVFSFPLILTGADGARNIVAQQTDVAGNQGSDNKNFIKDTVAPAVSITSPAVNTLARTGVRVTGTCETGYNVILTGAGATGSQTTSCTNAQFAADIAFNAPDGKKNIIAQQTDRAGNTGSANRDFMRDVTPPAIRISVPVMGTLTKGPVQVSGTCETGLAVVVSGSALGAGTQSLSCTAGQFAFNLTLSGADGTKQIIAAQSDAAGNMASDQTKVELDATAPKVTITAPNENSASVAGVTVSGTCETALEVVIGGMGVASIAKGSCIGSTFSVAITFSPNDGVKNIIATQTDRAGNSGSATRNFVRDSTAPVIAITSPAPNFEAQSGVRLQGNCESGINVDISGGGVASNSTTACTNGKFDSNIIFSNGDGVKTVMVSQRDNVGNVTQDQRNFIRDTVAPVVKISLPSANAEVKDQITLTGVCESGLPVSISGAGLAAPMTTQCNSNSFSQLLKLSNGDGVKVVTVSQTDFAGNKGSDNRNFNADTTAPVVNITSPVDGSVVVGSATLVGTCEANLNLTVNGAGVAFSVITPCLNGAFSTIVTFTSGDGNKIVTASQTDAIGNVGSATKTYKVDTGSPIVTIDTPAANTAGQNGVLMGGACETGLSVNLSGSGLASPNTAICTNNRFSVPITFSNGEGSKNIVASQTDLAGNSGSANRDFIKDTVAPLVSITSPIANSLLASTFTVSGSCETGINVSLSGGIASVSTTCNNGTFSVAVAASTGDGNKIVMARQTDGVGNIGSDTKTYTVDTTAPIVKITAPAPTINAQTSIELSGTCETGIEVVIYGPGVDGTIRTSCVSAVFVQTITFSIGEGAKIVNVSQTDTTGNLGTDSRTFQKDVTAPAIVFTAPVEGSVTKTAGVTVQGSCETGLTVNLLGTGLAAQSTAACSNGRFSANVNLAAGEGAKNIIGYQTDAAGNNGSAVLNLILDSVAPIVKITGPAAGSSYMTSVTVVGTCETGIDVSASGTGVLSNVTGACSNGQFSIAVNLSTGDGSKDIVVTQTDRAGNLGSDSRSFNRLSSSPVIKITAPPAGTRDQNGVTLQGTCETGLTINLSGAGLGSPNTTTCSAGQFSQAIVFSAGDGLKTILVSQTNVVGNTGSDQRDFVKGVVNGYEVFNVTLSNPRVDILFVDDNSSSMEKDQLKLGQKFSSFLTGLNGVDWQIGVTTTDCSTGPYGICGSLLPLTGSAGKVLSSGTSNYESVFLNTVYRPETVGCQLRGDCPSSNEQALVASMTAMDKRASDNAGFFRNDSDLAIVVLSDEDEKSNGPATATQAVTAQNHFKQIWPSGKKLSVYGIIIQPNDQTCLDTQVTEGGGFAFYGTIVDQWSKLTGGITGSICDADYSSNLQNIGRQVRNISDSVELAKTPIAGSVNVVFTPSQGITWTVQGNRVLFSSAPSVGTRIEVFYDSN